MTGPSYHGERTHRLFGTDPLWVGMVQSTDDTVVIDTTAGFWDLSATGTGGGGTGIMFDTDPQVGDWLIVTTTGATTREFFVPALAGTIGYGIVLETTADTTGRGVLVTTSGDGSPQTHALDVNVTLSGGVGKGIYVMANTTGTPTLLVGGDIDIEDSNAGVTIGWRSLISSDTADCDATGVSGNATTADGGEGTASGGLFFSSALGDGNSNGVVSQSSSTGAGESVGVDSISIGSGTGDIVAYRGHASTASGGPEAYGERLRLDQTGGGTTHLHPFEINVNGTVIFRVDPDGNVHIKTGATVTADL